MFVSREETDRFLFEHSQKLGATVKAHSTFLLGLLSEDDWSFVIKTHALVEAVVTDLITSAAGDDRFRILFERLPLSGDEFGKLTAAKLLALLTPPQVRFVRMWSSLRNSLVHKVDNLSFTFDQHVAQMDKPARRSWRETVIWFAGEDDTTKAQWMDIAIKQPKTAALMSLLMLVSLSSVSTLGLTAQRDIDRLAEKTMSDLMSSESAIDMAPTESQP